MAIEDKPPEVRIQVDYRQDKHGRIGRVFHLFDRENHEVIYSQKDACQLARRILKIAKEGTK